MYNCIYPVTHSVHLGNPTTTTTTTNDNNNKNEQQQQTNNSNNNLYCCLGCLQVMAMTFSVCLYRRIKDDYFFD